MTEIEKKTGMTDAECEYWDDFYTKNTFEPGPNLLKQGIKRGYIHSGSDGETVKNAGGF